MYLLDTNVVSELRRRKPHGGVLAWFRGVADADLHLSAVTIGEIRSGIECTRSPDPAKAEELDAWLEQVAAAYNVLAVDARTFRQAARLMHPQGRHLSEDAMIAATAHVHGLAVVTRNVRDFPPFGVRIVDPFTLLQP
jgi:predicted nucleic acid-binding protein